MSCKFWNQVNKVPYPWQAQSLLPFYCLLEDLLYLYKIRAENKSILYISPEIIKGYFIYVQCKKMKLKLGKNGHGMVNKREMIKNVKLKPDVKVEYTMHAVIPHHRVVQSIA